MDAEKIQVQHHTQSSVQQEQAQDGTAGNSFPGQEDDAVSEGAGHSNGLGGATHITGAAASGMNVSNLSAVRGGQDYRDQDGQRDERPCAVAFHVF